MKNTIPHIYVCHHKHGKSFSDDVFHPIHVGKELDATDIGFLGDNTGVNISNRNKQYCELTAIYWAWKNDEVATWLGLMHYRRLLNFGKLN